MQQLADQEPRAALAKRLRTITLAKRGDTAPEIATGTGFSRRVVQTWVARYNAEGLAGLETKAGRGRKPPLTPAQAERLKQRLDAGPLAGGRRVHVAWPRRAADSGARVRSTAVAQCGVWIVASPRLFVAEEFKKFGDRHSAIHTRHPGRRLQIFHEGEARFGQQGTLTRDWARTRYYENNRLAMA